MRRDWIFIPFPGKKNLPHEAWQFVQGILARIHVNQEKNSKSGDDKS